MSSFQPLIPTGREKLSVDYANIQGNFQQLDTSFGIDHLPFSNGTAQNGYHTDIHFVPVSTTTGIPANYPVPASTPVGIPDYGQLFTAVTNDGFGTDTMLFFKTGFNVLLQLTSNITPVPSATAGITFLPGGLVLQYGKTTVGAGTTTIGFNRPFPTNTYVVVATPNIASDPGSGYKFGVNSFTSTNFKFFQTSGSPQPNPVFWIALGN